MKNYLLFVFAFVLLNLGCVEKEKTQAFYVGTYTSAGSEGIYRCELNLETGDLEMQKSFGGIENPSFVVLSPDKKNLYSVSEAGEKGSFVYALKVDENKDLMVINKQSSNGQGPCHVSVSADGKFVATATYGGGTTSLYQTNADGSLIEASSVNINEGSGANMKRQSKPHAHSIKFSPYNHQVFSADLGTDQLDIYNLENGELKEGEQTFVKMAPGAGPRHLEFHPSKEVIYVINELNSTVSVVKLVENNWEVVQDISTLPEGFEGVSYCADIHISKDGKYLYGSNRGHNSIVVYKVNEKGDSLEFLRTVSVEGDWPRNFGITPDGNWLLVANQKSNDITVFKIDKKTGLPKFVGKKLEMPSPVCIEFL